MDSLDVVMESHAKADILGPDAFQRYIENHHPKLAAACAELHINVVEHEVRLEVLKVYQYWRQIASCAGKESK